MNPEDIADALENSDLEFLGEDDSEDEFMMGAEDSTDSSTDSEQDFVVPVAAVRRRTGRSRTRSEVGRNRIRRGSSTRGNRAQGRQRQSPSRDNDWEDKDFESTFVPHLYEPAYLPVDGERDSNCSYFSMYVDDELIELIVQKTNQTAIKNNGRSLGLTASEFKIYFGITFVMSAINYPQLRTYWETKWRVSLVADNMSRNRFLQLRTTLKIVFDDDVTPNKKAEDKLWRVRPLIDRILKGCRSQLRDVHLCYALCATFACVSQIKETASSHSMKIKII